MKLKMHSDGKKGILPYALGTASGGISYVIIGMLTYCLTTSYAMAGTTVGLIMLCSRVFDGITDVVAGFIIDRCHFKIGKARPFDLFNIPMWIFMMLCFEVPAFNTVGKVVYVFFMYNLCQSVCYTFVSVSSTVRVKRSFAEDVRAKALAVGAIVTALLSTILGILNPILISMFENQPHGWLIITGCYAVPGILMTLFMFFMLPEMDAAEETEQREEKKEEKITLKSSVKMLIQNPYLILVVIVVMANTLSNGIASTAGTYYFRYNLGNLTLASTVGLLSLVGYVFLLIMPMLTKKFGNRKSILISYVMVIAGNLAKLIVGGSIAGLAVCTALSTIGITFAMSIRDMVLIDCMHYGQLKTGMDGEGIYASVRGFSDKIATGLVSLLVGVVLDMGHFDGTVEVQAASAGTAITALYAVIPAVIGGIAFIAMYFCKMEDRIKEMEQAKLEQKV